MTSLQSSVIQSNTNLDAAVKVFSKVSNWLTLSKEINQNNLDESDSIRRKDLEQSWEFPEEEEIPSMDSSFGASKNPCLPFVTACLRDLDLPSQPRMV